MVRSAFEPETAALLQQLYQEHIAAKLRYATILQAEGPGSPALALANLEAVGIWSKIRAIRAEAEAAEAYEAD